MTISRGIFRLFLPIWLGLAAATAVYAQPDFTITKSHTGNFTQGGPGTYTIVVRNIGAASTPTDGVVTVTDTLPADLNAQAINGTGWNCTQPSGPCTRNDGLASNSNFPDITLIVNATATAAPSIVNTATVTNLNDSNSGNNTSVDIATVNQLRDLTISKTHTGDFLQGQMAALYTIIVSNIGVGPTVGTVSVDDSVPFGLTATNIAGTGWTCTQPSGPCTRADALAAGASYPPLTLSVNVLPYAPSNVSNDAFVSGGGETNTDNDVASDLTIIIPQDPDFSISKTHQGIFTQGQIGATYTIVVSNVGPVGAVGGSGPSANVSDVIPTGLTATNISGPGWNCTQPTGPCRRFDPLASGASYPPITVTVNVDSNAPATVINTATMVQTDPNYSNNTANDLTMISSSTVVITPPLQSSLLTESAPTHGDSITSGTNIPSFLLYINGIFDPAAFIDVSWFNPSTGVTNTFDSFTGVASVTPTQIKVVVPKSLFAAVTSAVPIAVRVDQANNSSSNPATFTLNPPLMSLGPNLPSGVLNTAYSQNIFTGGTSPFQVTLTSGDVPPGLTLSPTGPPLAGSPTSPGTYTFVPTITDAWTNTLQPTDTIQITTSASNAPTISNVVPGSTSAGLTSATLTVNGSNFTPQPPPTSEFAALPGSIVYWTPPNGQPVPLQTTFVSPTQLTAFVPGSLLPAPETVSITVVRPTFVTSSVNGSGVLTSNAVPFTVNPPSISTGGLQPSSTVVGSPAFTLAVTGADFVSNVEPAATSHVVFGSTPLTTTFVNSKSLTAQVPSSLLQTVGNVNVTVVNPGGATSNIATFAVVNFPTLISIAPTSSFAGGPAFTIQATGTNFTSGMSILWNGTALTGTTFVDSTHLTANVPASLITNPGTANVSVGYTGGTTTSLPFLINPALVINTSALPPGVVGASYASRVSAINALGVLGWSATGLPPGLGINALTGDITGTPTTVGNYRPVFTVTDGRQIASTQLQLNVFAKLLITTTALTPATPGASYSFPLAGTGGLSPYVWTATGLPSGLSVNASTGVISGTAAATGSSIVNVTLTDASNQTATAQFTLIVGTRLVITSTSLPSATTGSNYSFRLTASGGTPPYNWSASNLPAGLSLNPATGDITGIAGAAGSPSFGVTVRDNGGQTASAQLTINVSAPPPASVTITTTSLPPGTVGVVYGVQIAASNGTAPYTFSATGTLPPGLTLSSNGFLNGTPTTANTFRFTVSVVDSTGATSSAGSRDYTLLINPAPLVITGTVGDLNIGTPVTVKFGATGGVAPYAFGAGGSLPTGLKLAQDGTLSGTPTATGSFQFSVTVTDSTQTSVTKTFTVTVGGPLLTITTASLPNGQVAKAYSVQLAATGGGTPLTWSATGLPAGLTISSTGLISGTPTADGTSSVAVTVTDPAKATATQSYSLTITIAALTISNTSLPNGVVGVAYSATLTATGGTAPYTFAVTGLPDGVTATPAGVISGTPGTAGPFAVAVTVTDAKGGTATQTFNITIAPPALTITTASVPAAIVGTPVSVTFAVTGGVPPYTWSATGLPAGLTLSPAGVLSGTATAPSTGSIVITVKDGAGTTTSQTYSFAANLPASPGLNVTGLPPATNPSTQPRLQVVLGAPYPVDVTVTLTLTFAADSGPDDPAVQFDSGGRTAQVVIKAGTTVAANDIGVQVGTVAGNITITARLTAATQDVTPTPIPTRTIRISPAAPVITPPVTATRNSTGFTVVVSGFSSTRELTSAIFQFTPASGSSLQTTQLTVPVDALFAQWYQGTASAQFGSQFTLTQPFTVQGSTQGIASVTVTLVNKVGSSTTVSANLQ